MKRIVIILIFAAVAIKVYSQNFERVLNIDLKGGYLGFASWCDYNSDGLLDIFVTGIDFGGDLDHAEIFKNNGDKTFSETNVDIIPRVVYGDLSWGDFDNNGTLDLIYTGTISGKSEDNITKVYKNISDSSFVEIPHTLPNLAQCYVEWVDVNNDGLLDIYYQGINAESNFDLGIYKNNGNEEFEKMNINIDKIWGPRGNFTENSAKWADFDNDGLKDVIIAMSSSNDYNFEFYKNLGNFTFQKIDIGLPDLNYVNLAVGDLNQDGYYDIVFTGSSQPSLYSGDMDAHIYVFFNNGDLTFTKDYKINNVGVFWNTLELGDINNDGYLDIIDYGTGGSARITNIYLNNQDNTFNYLPHNLLNSSEGGASFGDFDNDNDLDILYYGRVYSPSEMEVTYVYENKSTNNNIIPEAPSIINIHAIDNDILVSWAKGSDDSTNSASLNYNLNFGTALNQNSLISSSSLNGKLKKIDLGNMNLNRNHLFRNLSEGSYCLKLQAIDNSYNASLFSDTLFFCFKSTSNLLGDSLFICNGDSIKVGISGEYKNYLWNNGSRDSIIYVKEEGLYNVNLTHLDGCISSETVFLKLNENPEIYLGEDIEACQGDTLTLQVQEFNEVLWSNNSDDNYINLWETGNYWVYVKDLNNCSNSDTTTVMFHPIPNVSLGNDTSIAQSDTLVLSIECSLDSYLWNNGSNNDSIIIYGNTETTADHIYWLMITDEFGCSNIDTIIVSVINASKISDLNGSIRIGVYPNPFQDEIVIEYKPILNGRTEVRILDTSGKLVYNSASNFVNSCQTIRLGSLKKGIYIINVINQSNNINQIYKIVK